MVSVQLEGIQALAIIIVPIALPYAIRQYHKFKQPRTKPPRPLHRAETLQLYLLFFLACFYGITLVKNFFRPAERDVFQATDSRLAISRDLLKSRAAKAGLSMSAAAWEVIDTLPGALIYLRLGARTLTDCTWCTLDVPTSFVLYSLAGIAPRYLAHLTLLSLATKRRTLFVLVTALAFGAETYARLGGFDHLNARAAEGLLRQKSATAGVLFLHQWLPLARTGFFLISVLTAGFLILLDAILNRDADSVGHITTLLQQTLEDLRVSSSLQRTITEEEAKHGTGDQGELQRTVIRFWQRHAGLIRKMDAEPVMTEARAAVAERLGDQRMAQEERELGSFLTAVLARLPDYSAAATAP